MDNSAYPVRHYTGCVRSPLCLRFLIERGRNGVPSLKERGVFFFMDAVWFLVLGFFAVLTFLGGINQKRVVFVMLSAGLFFVLGVLFYWGGVQFVSGQTVNCLDVNGAIHSGAGDCSLYGYQLINDSTSYTRDNNVVVLLFGLLSWFFCILNFTYLIGFMGKGRVSD
jgi:hypothetical protein